MFDPEYFMSEYEIRDLSTGTVRLASGRYRDFADAGPREEILHDDAVTDERQTFYCISVPGEAAWAQDSFKKMSPDCNGKLSSTSNIPSTSNPSRTMKRGLEDMQETDNASTSNVLNQKGQGLEDNQTVEEMDASDVLDNNSGMAATSCDPSTSKKTKTFDASKETLDNREKTETTNGTNNKASTRSLNLPIPNSSGKSSQPSHLLSTENQRRLFIIIYRTLLITELIKLIKRQSIFFRSSSYCQVVRPT